jgi:cytidine deaminase
MTEKVLKITYEEFDTLEQLSEEDRSLLALALLNTQNAYAPYSEFYVGAAILLDNGEIVCGSNQENAAYPSGLCAERVAMFAAGSQYPNASMLAIAITVHSDKFEIASPISPCGSCRQVVAEYEHRQKKSIKIILRGAKGKIWVINGIDNLLPFVFTADNLK